MQSIGRKHLKWPKKIHFNLAQNQSWLVFVRTCTSRFSLKENSSLRTKGRLTYRFRRIKLKTENCEQIGSHFLRLLLNDVNCKLQLVLKIGGSFETSHINNVRNWIFTSSSHGSSQDQMHIWNPYRVVIFALTILNRPFYRNTTDFHPFIAINIKIYWLLPIYTNRETRNGNFQFLVWLRSHLHFSFLQSC